MPSFPSHPPEFSWPAVERTALPGLYLNEGRDGGGRVAYLPFDLDRSFGRWSQPDHGQLLAALVRWTLNAPLPVEVHGPGIVDVHLWTQPGRAILHLVNLTTPSYDRPPAHDLVAVGPYRVTLAGVPATTAGLLVAGTTVPVVGSSFELPSILDHEVISLE